MIKIKLKGGLGNQMFQYAIARSLAIKNNTDIFLDIYELENSLMRDYELNNFKIDASIYKNNSNKLKIKKFLMKLITKLNLEILIPNYFYERKIFFDKSVLSLKKNSYLEGYFQSEKYFAHIRKTLLSDFQAKDELSIYAQIIAKSILNKKNSVSLHIRRGDYLSNKEAFETHGICDINYYVKSIRFLSRKFVNMHIFVFSDDIKWAKENLNYPNITYVDSDSRRAPHEDMLLMSLCQNNIIANSSFSWWGAWLNRYDNKIVIAPKQWFKDIKMQASSNDIVPDDWKKI